MTLHIQLEPIEARVLGVLIEKDLTTPEQYPLSLNALSNGCNQKSNRHPMISVSEAEVQQAILRLRVAQLVEFVKLVGQRVEKYRHTAAAALHLEPAQVAVMAELLLRGPQTAGELRQRAERMHALESLAALDAVLGPLMERGLVVRLPPEPGSRAPLYAQRLCPDVRTVALRVTTGTSPTSASTEQKPPSLPAWPADKGGTGGDLAVRVAALEAEVARLRSRLESFAAPAGASS